MAVYLLYCWNSLRNYFQCIWDFHHYPHSLKWVNISCFQIRDGESILPCAISFYNLAFYYLKDLQSNIFNYVHMLTKTDGFLGSVVQIYKDNQFILEFAFAESMYLEGEKKVKWGEQWTGVLSLSCLARFGLQTDLQFSKFSSLFFKNRDLHEPGRSLRL